MKIVAIIPARMASARFPNKVLYKFHGLPMIEHVRRRALLSKTISEVIVATCDQEIAEAIKGYGGKVVMTADTHTNGTSRIAEAVADIECSHALLLQGDEPLLLPRHLEVLIESILKTPNGDAWNATAPIEDEDELDRHSFVKCAVSPENNVMYCFRRSPCYSDFIKQQQFVHKMLGIIAYRKDFLLQLTSLPDSIVEKAESIEQMRIIENGYRLQAVSVSPSLPSVNEPEEADIVSQYLIEDEEQKSLLRQIL